MLSMTGYVFLEESLGNDQFAIEIISLNNRFLEIITNVPSYFSSYESQIKKIIASRVNRGKVKVNLNIKENKPDYDIQLDFHLAQKYYTIYKQMINQLALESKIKLEHILKEDGVFNIKKNRDTDEIWKKTENLFYKSLDLLMNMKSKEGKAIEQNIINILDQIKIDLDKVKYISPKSLETNTLRVKKRLSGILMEQFDEQRILTEVAILASKIDINEEIERLSFHIEQFKQTCFKEVVVGKKLDFFSQEMLREINTISSKANDFDISSLVVNMKSNLEKIKEQIRNVE